MKWSAFADVLPVRNLVRLGIAFAAFFLPTYLFVELADEVREQETIWLDETILRTVNSFSSDALDALAVVLTQLGGVVGVTVVTIGLAVLLWGRGMKKRTVTLLAGVGGAALLNLLLKVIFQRDRPELWERLVVENSYSFPSGHAMASSALALSLIAIFWSTRWRWWVVAGSVSYTLLIGLTRLYLGVHYPTDVVAGWMVSAAWVTTAIGAIGLRTRLFRSTNP